MFKKCKVVMLPANEKAKIGDIVKVIEDIPDMMGDYLFDRDELFIVSRLNKSINSSQEGFETQHLYILSDDEIENGNYILSFYKEDKRIKPFINEVIINEDNQIYCIKDIKLSKQYYDTYKIIATTDPKLNLPKPSKAFIKKYCDKGGIDEIKVRYKVEPISDYAKKKLGILPDNRYWVLGDRGLIPNSYWLKCNFGTIENTSGSGFVLDEDIKCVPITKNNTVSIKPIPKKTYTREEVVSLLESFEADLEKGLRIHQFMKKNNL